MPAAHSCAICLVDKVDRAARAASQVDNVVKAVRRDLGGVFSDQLQHTHVALSTAAVQEHQH